MTVQEVEKVEEQTTDSGVDKDVHVDLPFPMLVATDGRLAIVCKIVGNQWADLAIIDMSIEQPNEFAGKPIASVRIELDRPPVGTTVAMYWTTMINATAAKLYEAFIANQVRTIATPAKPKLVRANGAEYTGVRGS